MKELKLLVYSDGGLYTRKIRKDPGIQQCMYGSYAIYYVDPNTSWGMVRDNMGWSESEEDVAKKHYDLFKTKNPAVHVRRATMLLGDRERPTNNLAEAKTLRKAVQYVQNILSRNDANNQVGEIEFCLDSKLVLDTVKGVFGKAKSDYGFKNVANEVKGMVDNMAPRKIIWSWINGDVMKRIIIGH